MNTNLHPRGIFSAALTPLDADLLPDHTRFVAHCHRLLAEGCDGIALLGTTCEANSFPVMIAASNKASRFLKMPSLKVMPDTKLQDDGWRRMHRPLLPPTQEETTALLKG